MENKLNAANNNDSEAMNVNNSDEFVLIIEDSFDMNLPATHSYLGTNLEELRGRTLLDEGIYTNLPLLIKNSIVLFPGQTLPLAVFGPNVINMLLKCIENNRTFGVVCMEANKLEAVGTTAEIYEHTQNSPVEGFRIKAKGRQRFQILQIKQTSSEISATVKIIPEKILPHPFIEYKLSSLNCQRVDPAYERFEKRDRIEKFEAIITSWPAWIYNQYDPYILSFKIRKELKYLENRGKCIPTDPIDLSFWAAQNLPLNNSQRIELLKFDCAISRLQWELKYLTLDRVLVCNHCDEFIANPFDIFLMSKEGPQSTYCNAGGVVHDTITITVAENLELIGHSSFAYSWFPGYAWTVAVCKSCRSHIGWLFTTSKKKILKPEMFWGLSRGSLKSKKIEHSND